MLAEIFWFCFLVCNLVYFLPSGTSADTDSPSQIIEIFRHGARGPLTKYDQSWLRSEWGQLTIPGVQQQYSLGKTLAQRYPNLLQNTSEIYFLSDDTPRCVQSAKIQLSGIQDFFNNKEESLNLFEINVVNESNKHIFKRAHGSQCPNGYSWERANAKSAKSQEAWQIFKETIDVINKALPEKNQLSSTFKIAVFGDALLVNIFHNRSLVPFGIEDAYIAKNFVHIFSWFVFNTEYGQEVQKQISAFPLIDEMLQQLEAFRKGEEHSKKAALYSAHDYNIYAVLAAFGVINEECIMANYLSSVRNETLPHPNCYFPFFASNLVVELYNQTKNPRDFPSTYVKVSYNYMALPLCNGQEVCEYNDFIEFAKKAIGNNTHESYTEKCNVKTKRTK